MSGHNKWSQIKHRKGAQDLRRSKAFTKIVKEIAVAVKKSGPDPQHNPRLRAALLWAKEENMPQENIQRAIKKSSGKDAEDNYEEITYEGFASGNVALVVECLSNNRNRTISNLRVIFNKNHGHLGGNNSCVHLFQKLGWVEIFKRDISEEKLLEIAMELDLKDYFLEGENYALVAEFSALKALLDFLEEKKIPIQKSTPNLLPKEKLFIEDLQTAQKIMQLVDALEDDDDVQRVYGNFELQDELLAEMMKE